MNQCCPICGSVGKDVVFPYGTHWNKKYFKYIKCIDCQSTFVNPLPNNDDFEVMYSKHNYHNKHYSEFEADADKYSDSVKLLKSQVSTNKTLLDFGCGNGAFLAAAKSVGFQCTGIEVDAHTIEFASNNSKCPVLTLEQVRSQGGRYDIIHLGDVLEHLAHPASLLEDLKTLLNEGGVFFIEGPLENNPSPVYFCANFFGFVKRIISKSTMGSHAPTHLFRVTAGSQQVFFTKRLSFQEKYFEVYETGWPYLLPESQGISIKILIGRFAKSISGKRCGKFIFGNRFFGLYVVDKGCE